MSMMMPPGAPPMDPGMDPGMGAPPATDAGGDMGSLLAALGGGGGDPMAQDPTMNSQAMMGDMTDPNAELEDEEGEDPETLIREAIQLLRRAGDIEQDDSKSHLIDKSQADLQKILAGSQQKMSSLRSALGG